MRRLDWFLAAVVASFLAAVLALHTFGWRPDASGELRWSPAGQVETTVRRLVAPRMGSPMHANCPAPWAAPHHRREVQS